jgi:hypothetical protein
MPWRQTLLLSIGLAAFMAGAAGVVFLIRPGHRHSITPANASSVLGARPGFGPERVRAVTPPSGALDLLIQASAMVIGLPESDLRSTLQRGQSLVQVAASYDMSADDLEEGVVLQEQTTLAAALASGRLNNNEATQLYRPSGEELEELLNRPGGPLAPQRAASPAASPSAKGP